MNNLTQLNCNYENNYKDPLKRDDILEHLKTLDDWGYDTDKGHLIKKFRFKNFYHTMNFVNAVAWIANREAHHPDLQVSYGHCEVIFTTHDSGNQVTMNDLICAAKVEALTLQGAFGPQAVL